MPTKNAKKPAQKKTAKKRIKFQDLTPQQKGALKRKHNEALRRAREEIAAGGYTYQKTTKDGFNVYASNEELVLHITTNCLKNACRSSKKDCVIAQAIKRQQPWATGWLVGKNICMIYNDASKEIIRYGTSGKLSRALQHYDRTGQWPLVTGYYVLLPLPAGYRVGTRWAWYKGTGGKASKFKGMLRAAPTRRGNYLGSVRKIA